MKKKIFAVSDIHGHFTEFKKELDASGFESGNPDHLLVFCGDLFDRGTENMKVMQFFERTENRIMVRGNHEDMLLTIFNEGRLKSHNFLNGTVATITEFFGKYSIDGIDNSIDFSGKTRTVDRITELILSMKDYYETEHCLFVHGWLPNRDGIIPGNWRNAGEADWKSARITKWTKVYTGTAPVSGKTVVCGHYPTFYAKNVDSARSEEDCSPYFGNGVIAIDGGTYNTGKVNIVVIEDALTAPEAPAP